jgi:hypothetical protein
MFYTLFIDHSFTASMRQGVNGGFKVGSSIALCPQLRPIHSPLLQFNAQSLSGSLRSLSGDVVQPCLFSGPTPCDPQDAGAPVRVGVAGKPDIIPLGNYSFTSPTPLLVYRFAAQVPSSKLPGLTALTMPLVCVCCCSRTELLIRCISQMLWMPPAKETTNLTEY